MSIIDVNIYCIYENSKLEKKTDLHVLSPTESNAQCVISTSVLYIQASVFPGTCPYKVGSELCPNYVRFDVLIWGIIPHDNVTCKI